MATGRATPFLVAAGIGVVSGVYIWNKPLQELTGHSPAPDAIKDGRSQTVKDGGDKDGSPSSGGPHTALRYGGSSLTSKDDAPSVAGTSPESRKGYSADHDIKTRSNAKEQDGSSGGGVGVAEMRERKMEGRGLPSPQGGDTKPKPVAAATNDGEGGGIKPKANGRWWLGGW
ncbi:hypothetical protein BCR39DRAFT_564983 [Naematelia encephala]|uniref:Uncharacterized protein n=1 Tax=Naematelia encephala TaxID=71784 RepID=A0A1Y2B571_9TREE|nr:hypothetical protein BCR39DRAFT_564983 [Naematelia encephala]